MLDMELNERAVAGDNNPPAHVTWMDHAESLVEIAEGMVEITTPEQAAGAGQLADDAKKAARDADNARKADKKPHMDAAAAVDANYKPITERLDRVAGVARALLTPWLAAQRAAEQRAAAEAKAAAEAADEEARRLAAVADQTDIADVEAAAKAEAEAKGAAQEAKNAKVKPATVQGVQFRTYYTPEMTDRKALLTHIAQTDPKAMTDFGMDWMRRAVNAGAREIPGVTITEEKRAV